MTASSLAVALLLAVLGVSAGAAGPLMPPLPQPLTLTDALRLAREAPSVQQAGARREVARAGVLAAEAFDGVRLTATGRAVYIDPSPRSLNDSNNDSSASLTLSKRLLDFGYSEALKNSARTDESASEFQLLAARLQARQAVKRAFYDVLLADLEYARDNEEMAIAFIASDRLNDRSELGQASDISVLEGQSDFQLVRRRQIASAGRQVTSRARLAIAMGRPGELVSDLVTPEIRLPQTQPDDFEAFWSQVLVGNPELLALRARREAAAEQVKAARAEHGPVLSAEIDRSEWNRYTGSTHPFSAGLVLQVPLFTGGAKDASLAAAQAQVSSVTAMLAEAEARLRIEAMQLWMARNSLRADVQAYQLMGDFRDLYLDRSRALYEMEVKADLGDAMARTSEVRLQLARALFEWDLNQTRLQAMTGRLSEEQP